MPLFIIVFFLLVLIIAYITFLALKLRKSDYRGRKLIGTVILFIVALIIFRIFFVAEYPDPNSAYKVEGIMVREYNAEESYLVADVNKWVDIKEFGWMYVDRIESVDGQQFRMFYRVLGMHLDDVFNLNMTLSDSNSNMYENDGGGLHGALLSSAGAMNFLLVGDTIKDDDNFLLMVAGEEYSLY